MDQIRENANRAIAARQHGAVNGVFRNEIKEGYQMSVRTPGKKAVDAMEVVRSR